ncbi:MAG: hypothetical protein ACOC2C_04735, partial [Cyclonatronaceae bacterium]
PGDAPGYEFNYAPDAWYNDVDGIRLGIRVRGQMPGSFDDGPHRLDAGLWLSTWFPELPVSYYVKYTNPIPRISAFNSEGSYSIETSLRTGFHRHGLGLSKRWQPGFNEDEFTELRLFTGAYRHYDEEYLPFSSLWQQEWTGITEVNFLRQRLLASGAWSVGAGLRAGYLSELQGLGDVGAPDPAGESAAFARASLRLNYDYSFGESESWRLRLRGSGSLLSKDTPPEHRVMASAASAYAWMDSGFFRAKGTIPTPWMNAGTFQLTGSGPNLRGYTRRDMKAAGNGTPIFYEAYTALNLELDYPNPIDKSFQRIPIAGDFLRLRSYLFADGFSGQRSDTDSREELADAGAGMALTLNIPNQLGQPRGFVLRYDVPLWLSDAYQDEANWAYRNVLSFGVVIGF